MMNSNQWPSALPDFLDQAQALLSKLQECLSHLELICNDQDAADCLLNTLGTLSAQAQCRSLPEIAAFCHQVEHLLRLAQPRNRLQGDTLGALHQCLTLLAWQVELIDPCTGQLCLDDDEQNTLVQALAACIETEGAQRLRVLGSRASQDGYNQAI
ncbi:MAG: Hpt domain-containing protein [Pseudomonas sp.]|nr:Hpt domain-containing protein [Pseudomonas sp.]